MQLSLSMTEMMNLEFANTCFLCYVTYVIIEDKKGLVISNSFYSIEKQKKKRPGWDTEAI